MHKPSHLPFHLLAWSQFYIRYHNCIAYRDRNYNITSSSSSSSSSSPAIATSSSSSTTTTNTRLSKRSTTTSTTTTTTTSYIEYLGFPNYPIDHNLLPTNLTNEYQICLPHSIANYHGGPIHVVYSYRNLTSYFISHSQSHYEGPISSNTNNNKDNNNYNNDNNNNSTKKHKKQHSFTPLQYVYYTECDQIVRFDSEETFQALLAATNETTFFTGRRKEKNRESNPVEYMNGLDQWRECGIPGYELEWPTSHWVYPSSS
jgi:hypothetical protein